MAVGEFVRTIDWDHDEDNWYVVRSGGLLFVLSEAAICDAQPGEKVVFGGLVAGPFATDNGDVMPVLPYGIAVSEVDAPGAP